MTITNNENDENLEKVLNHDINMIFDSEKNRWDWNIKGENLDIAIGIKSLFMGCVQKLLTGYHECRDNPTFNSYGNRTYELIKQNKNNLTSKRIEEYTRQQLLSMNRVKFINYIHVHEILEDQYSYQVDYQIVAITDDVVEGDIILKA